MERKRESEEEKKKKMERKQESEEEKKKMRRSDLENTNSHLPNCFRRQSRVHDRFRLRLRLPRRPYGCGKTRHGHHTSPHQH